LRKAEAILQSKPEKEKGSTHLQNILNDVSAYIEKIEQGDGQA
jgi:hypothetical protein